jgi:hypothetical protein
MRCLVDPVFKIIILDTHQPKYHKLQVFSTDKQVFSLVQHFRSKVDCCPSKKNFVDRFGGKESSARTQTPGLIGDEPDSTGGNWRENKLRMCPG